MTVKDAMDEIRGAKEYAKLLYVLADKQTDEHTQDYLREASDMLDRYVDMLESMKVVRT